jgi:hypothetical protein
MVNSELQLGSWGWKSLDFGQQGTNQNLTQKFTMPDPIDRTLSQSVYSQSFIHYSLSTKSRHSILVLSQILMLN